MKNERQYLKDLMVRYLEPVETLDIVEWASEHVDFSNGTAEPGRYDPKRAPYQEEILRAISPSSLTKEVYMLTGAQIGKTTVEMLAMAYYMKEFPRAQAFAFPNRDTLDEFVKTKFNPFISTNGEISDILGRNIKGSGNTISEKIYPGGFLRFVSANSEGDTRSYSVENVIMDEIDAYPSDLKGNGDPIELFRNRSNTFEETRKLVASSTPYNEDSAIIRLVEASTKEKYFVRCPHCGEYMTFEWQYFRYLTDESGAIVLDTWMTCPNCSARILEIDKPEMMSSEGGAEWRATNPSASEERRGFILPSFYVPLGWLSWKSIAQRYVDAIRAPEDRRERLVTAFYNTVLAQQYKTASYIPEWQALYEIALKGPFLRGRIPSWVGAITTGSDVQKNRIETTVMGWGKRGRNIVIDHMIFMCDPGETTEDLSSAAWSGYQAAILEGTFVREDGYRFSSIANGCDRSYVPLTVDNAYLRFRNPSFYPLRGDNKHNVDTGLPTRTNSKMTAGAVIYNTPVDRLKQMVYAHLMIDDDENGQKSNAAFFPADLPQEFFEQLCAETQEYNKKKKTYEWVKTRDRNEALDCRVYNYAVWLYNKLDAFSDDEWDEVFESQAASLKAMKGAKKNLSSARRRTISKGIVL